MALSVDIEKKLGDFHLRVAFEAGDCVHGLLGASGCGKSLTLRCIAGIERPDRGHIEVDGRVLFDSKERIDLTPQRRRVGLLFQNYALFPNMTLRGNLMTALRGRPRREAAAKAEEMLARFRLTDRADLRPSQLSGGQQQRAALARILLTEPAVLLLDEPLSALDSFLRWQTELELMELLEDFAGTTLLVTHSRDEVHRLCETVTVLSEGEGRGAAPVKLLFTAPETLSQCLLSGCKNYSRLSRSPDGTLWASDWGAALRCDAPVPPEAKYLAVRAHHLVPAEGSGENVLRCRVLREVRDVFSTIVMLATPGGDTGESRLRLELSHEAWAPWAGREELYVLLPPEHLMPLQ